MLSFPHAKINLGLNVIEKRKDGFHNIESVFYPIKLYDVLEIIENKAFKKKDKKIKFHVSGIQIHKEGDNNLCEKAYQALDSEFNLPPVKIHLHKNIPIGAGLGGGSSDGAFTLKMFCDLFNLKIKKEVLIKIASELGSDCSFFLEEGAAFGTEKGEVLEPCFTNLSLYKILLVCPQIHIPTKEAYKSIKPTLPQKSLKELIKLPLGEWKGKIKNDFEDTVFLKHPELKEIKNLIYEKGAIYASMSGSGSSIYGIFKKRVEFDFADCKYYWVTSVDSSPKHPGVE